MADKVGLIAGWGRFPLIVAERLQKSGKQVYCLGIHGHADAALKRICHDYREVGLTRMGAHIRYMKKHGVQQATMAGKLFKTILFERFAWLKHFPDLTFWRFYYPHFLTKSADRRDDTILLTFTEIYHRYGIHMAPATDFAPELLVKQGTLTKRRLTDYQMKDIEFAWKMAKQMGQLDIGQSVAVKGRAVLAVEAVEGTDACIRRAGELCPSGGFTVVKVAKPQQDMRFDVPTVGVGTLETMVAAGASVLAIEADKTILLDRQELIQYANQHRLTVVALTPQAWDKPTGTSESSNETASEPCQQRVA